MGYFAGRALAQFIWKRPLLRKWYVPFATRYTQALGYQKMGLRNDDLIVDEDETVLKAIDRLSQKEKFDRVWRIRRAFLLSATQKILPEAEWTKPEEDIPYLTPILDQMWEEEKEREAFDSMTVIPKQH